MEIDLRAELRAYLSLRKSFGNPVNQIRPVLEKFVDYLAKQSMPVSAQQVLEWACAPHYSPSTQHVWLSTARMFLKHLKVIIPEIAIPRVGTIAPTRRREPFVFSQKQIAQLILAAGEMEKKMRIEPVTLQTMLGLMACTGLRPGEVLRLKMHHVVLDDPTPRLLIQCTKFGKSRWVPLHRTAVEQLRLYLQSRQQWSKKLDALFISKLERPINRNTFHRLYQQLIATANIRPRPGQSRPTPQSLRHTFAVHRLQLWYAAGKNVREFLPNLSVYLGHLNPSHTYWYLSCTPQLMTSAAERFEDYAGKEEIK